VYIVGEEVDVEWSSPSNRSIFLDWIGMYRPGNNDRSFIQYEYVDIFSNVEDFRLNQTGTYEFRYFTNNSYNRVATSDTITVVPDALTCALDDLSGIENFPLQTGPIVAVGDSLTFGVGASAGQNYVDELENRFGVPIINAGVSGDTTLDVLARLDTDVLDLDPSLVIVFIGGNDELRRVFQELLETAQGEDLEDRLLRLAQDLGYQWEDVPLITREETFNNIRSIVNQIQSSGAATMVIGINSPIYQDLQLNDWYENVAKDTNSIFISNIYDNVFSVPRLKSDLIHPNDEGYDIFADRIGLKLACLVQ
jgi:acyl-CoA hydrolase